MFLMSTSFSQLTEMYLLIGMPLRFISRDAITCMFERLQLMIQSGSKRRICVQADAWSFPGKRIREELEIEAFLGGQRLEDADRLLPEWIVDIEERDLDALQVPALLLLDVGDVVRRLAPVGRADRKHPLEYVTVDGVAATCERLHHDIAVLVDAWQHGSRYRRRQEVEHHHALALELLVALDTALGLVAVILHDDFDGMPADATLLVEQCGVITRGLRHLRRDERIRLSDIVAERELASDPGPRPEHDGEYRRRAGESCC